MSVHKNAADERKSVTGGDLECTRGPRINNTNASISPPESPLGFRGFPQPLVLLPPIDITPFLKSKCPANLETVSKPEINRHKSILKKPSYDKFNSKCCVNVLREDLEELKNLVRHQSGFLKHKGGSPGMSMKCNICDKTYSSVRKLLNHQQNKHMIIKAKTKKRVSFSDKVIVHEMREYHKCRKCPKIFENYRALKSHMKIQHKKRKCYICNYCSKKFVDRMFFKVHIKLHCESCGELFTSKTKCIMHKRRVCRILKLHQCKTCEISFFKLMDLRDHSYDHIENCYICDICKDQCPTKCGIAHHIYYLHSKRIRRRNPTMYITRKLGNESLYLCKFCEESSVDRNLIEQHVQLLPDLNNRVMTGYKDYYFCDQCLKKFSTEKEMLQHKWTHFLKSPDKSHTKSKGNVNGSKIDVQKFYNIKEEIPEIFQVKVVLEKIKVPEEKVASDIGELSDTVELVETAGKETTELTTGLNTDLNNIKKSKSRKTLISKHQCTNCSKYFSSNHSLNRHIETQHSDYENLRCKVCEEVFVWPSLLQSHKCIRVHIPEMPFEDARPEIHFDNLHEINLQNNVSSVDTIDLTNGFDDLNIVESDDYSNVVDFDIPAPVVELAEYGNNYNIPILPNVQMQNGLNQSANKVNSLQSLGYKLVMQEVPIEF